MEGVLRLKVKVEQKLRMHSLRPTKARIRIGMMLFDRPKHLSADQIFDQIKEHGYGISKATVYNTLNVFAKQGVVNEVAVDPTRMYYDSNVGFFPFGRSMSAHHHFYNTDTRELTDIPRENLSVENIPRLPDNTEIEDLEIVIKIKNKQPS